MHASIHRALSLLLQLVVKPSTCNGTEPPPRIDPYSHRTWLASHGTRHGIWGDKNCKLRQREKAHEAEAQVLASRHSLQQIRKRPQLCTRPQFSTRKIGRTWEIAALGDRAEDRHSQEHHNTQREVRRTTATRSGHAHPQEYGAE